MGCFSVSQGRRVRSQAPKRGLRGENAVLKRPLFRQTPKCEVKRFWSSAQKTVPQGPIQNETVFSISGFQVFTPVQHSQRQGILFEANFVRATKPG